MSARFVLLLAGLLAFVPSSAQALELKNIRSSYGYLGATRSDAKFLPGDYLFMTYDIDGLKLDDKNRASYTILLEVFNAANKAILTKPTPPNVQVPHLGGGRIPGDLHVIMGNDHPPGKYTARLTVMDSATKEIKSFTHPFELLPKGFGIVAVMAPTIAFPGQPYMLSYNIVELGLDAANKPKAKVETKIFDDVGKLLAPPSIINYPADLPENLDLKKANSIPIDFPIFPNRVGRFIVEVTVTDAINNKTAPPLRYPVHVLDVGALAGK